MAIEIKHNVMNAYKKLEMLSNNLNKVAMIGLEKAGTRLMDKLRESDLPEEYKDALKMVVVPNENMVVVGFKLSDEAYSLIPTVSHVEYVLYRCPAQKYFGGTIEKDKLARQPTDTDLELLMQGTLPEIVKYVTDDLKRLITGEFKSFIGV